MQITAWAKGGALRSRLLFAWYSGYLCVSRQCYFIFSFSTQYVCRSQAGRLVEARMFSASNVVGSCTDHSIQCKRMRAFTAVRLNNQRSSVWLTISHLQVPIELRPLLDWFRLVALCDALCSWSVTSLCSLLQISSIQQASKVIFHRNIFISFKSINWIQKYHNHNVIHFNSLYNWQLSM